MKKHRILSTARRPEIRGHNKIEVRISYNADKKVYIARGYIFFRGKRTCIGDINAYKNYCCNYLTVGDAYIQEAWIGRGYGHILYWSLAKKAKKMGMKGLRSYMYSRSEKANRAWEKIMTHSRGEFSYIKFD